MDEQPSEQPSDKAPNEKPFQPPLRRFNPFSWDRRTQASVLLITVLALVTGVAVGIRTRMNVAENKQADQERKKKQTATKKAKKPDLVILPLETLPSQTKTVEISFDKRRPTGAKREVKTGSIKPGHWVSAMQRMMANHRDHSASIETMVRNSFPKTETLPRSPFQIRSTRPVSLPKGQKKFVESTFLVPFHGDVRSFGPRKTRVTSILRHRLAGSEMEHSTRSFDEMAASEYFFYVLARRPGDYQFLLRLPSTRVQREHVDEFDAPETYSYYRIVVPPTMGNRIAPVTLPANPLTWTSIAYLLWDDVETDRLSQLQQRAMIDWLHWGGQLIISGPNSLELLKGSFLEPYLPATAKRSREITAEALQTINGVFAYNGETFRPLPGVELKRHRDAIAIDRTGDLLYERRIGRGRIVVSAFRLATPPTERPGLNIAYDRFFATCILGQHERRSDAGERTAGEICKLRYFSRDAGDWTLHREQPEWSGLIQGAEASVDGLSSFREITSSNDQPAHRKTGPGVAGWSDFSPVSQVARESLRKAAGIKIPDADFVVAVLAIYLAVLVPVNWLVFRLIGRVEWAWVSTPLIAIVCAFVVIDQAQLDIGFARARTEFTVVEMQGGFSRAHVTRYTALYTSLSTSYEAVFEDPQALVAPFSKGKQFQKVFGQESGMVDYRREGAEIRLSGFQVPSNSTDWLHSEQMVELGGTIDYQQDVKGKSNVMNHTDLPLEGVAVIRRNRDDSFQVAWIGKLDAHESADVEFRDPDDNHLVEPQWTAAARIAGAATSKKLNLQGLLEVAQRREDYRQGDVRLIGWTAQRIEGMTVDPADSQSSYATLVITHLRHGK